MEDIRDEIVVDAPIATVWAAIIDTDAHAEWHPFLTAIAGEHAKGSIRRCSVDAGGKQGQTEERCTEFDDGRRIMWTIEADTTGFSKMAADWTSGFELSPEGARSTRVRAQSRFRPAKPFVRLVLPMIRRKFHQTHRIILQGLKAHAEQPTHAR